MRAARDAALRWFARLPVRRKLQAMVLLPLLVVLPLLGLLLLWWSSEALDRLLITKVRADLAVAQGYFERVLGEVGTGTAAVAESHRLLLALQQPAAALPAALEDFRQRAGLDFLHLHGPDGRLLASDRGPLLPGRGVDLSPHAPDLLRTSVEVLGPDLVEALGPTLAARVPVQLLPTRNAAPTQRALEDRALVLLSTQTVRDADRRLLGYVQGGLLLNRNLGFVDHINGIVYPEGSLPFGSRGTATLFLEDVRISTNVRLFNAAEAGDKNLDAGETAQAPGALGRSERAIGTRVSQTVRDAVLLKGSTWLDRAFVVNEWYVSAYQPLQDGSGRPVGMLYVGFSEAPFTLLKYSVLASIGLVFFCVMIGSAWVSVGLARRIFRPLEAMEATMQLFEGGDSLARVGSGIGLAAADDLDDIGRLARHFDELLDRIDQNTRVLQRWNAELDAKVAERTAQLKQAQDQLVKNEKLAAVGQLTASIAHEVNNPIAVIQGNLDLLRELLGPAEAQRVAVELKLMDEQVERMRLIVTQLLQFSRPAEFAGYVEAVDTRGALLDCLVLVGHLLGRSRIRVRQDLMATRTTAINRQELQQVLVNLLVNAIQAMPEGGELLLSTQDTAGGEVEIRVADTGPGLSAEVLAALFQPFFTRKREGTGLGLWISRNLVERYGGTLVAANRNDAPEGHGAVFVLRLPSEAVQSP